MKHFLSNFCFFIKKSYVHGVKGASLSCKIICLYLLYFSTYVIGALVPKITADLLDGALSLTESAPRWNLLSFALGGFVLNTLIQYFYKTRRQYLETIVGDRIQLNLKTHINGHALKIDYSAFNSPKIYETIQFVQDNLSGFAERFWASELSLGIIGTAASILITLSILVKIDVWVAMTVLLGNIVGVWQNVYQSRHNYYLAVDSIPENRWGSAYLSPLTDRDFLKEVRFYNLYGYLYKKWEGITVQLNKKKRSLSWRFFFQDIFHAVFSRVFHFSALALTAKLIIDGKGTIGDFALVYTAISSMLGSSGVLLQTLAQYREIALYTEKWKEFEDIPETEPDISGWKSVPEFHITMKDIDYAYPQTQRKILKDISVTIRQGEKIAIVGKNGSGKSTFVSVLNGLYPPDSGEITGSCGNGTAHGADGHPAVFCREYGHSGHDPVGGYVPFARGNIMTLFQDYPFYDASIRENVAWGDSRGCLEDRDIWRCLEKVGLDSKVRKYPDQLDTAIGTHREGGVQLSIGEAQRLAIARILAREDSRIYILDEPTAALDAIVESDIYGQILSVADTGDTVIFVSHRMTVSRFVDRILVFDDGRIIEDGPHEELMKIPEGAYRSMYEAQSALYK